MQPEAPKNKAAKPLNITLVSEGVELYNLGKDRQIPFFTTIESGQESRSFQIPKLVGTEKSQYLADGETRDSLPIVGKLHQTPDGTFYIGAAGGVLNRLTPNGQGGYKHSYAILDHNNQPTEPLRFDDNPAPVALLAQGNTLKSDPVVHRLVEGVDTPRNFFDTYRKKPENFDVLVEQGVLDETGRKELWAMKRQTYKGEPVVINGETVIQTNQKVSMDEAYSCLKQIPESERANSPLAHWLESKDGSSKRACAKIWDKNILAFPKEAPEADGRSIEKPGSPKTDAILSAADQLSPGLSSLLKGNLYAPEYNPPKYKPYDERLPMCRVNLSGIEGDDNQIVVAVMDKLYRLDHDSGDMHFVGTINQEATRPVDIRSVVALDRHTFIIGDMGTEPKINGEPTFRVIVDQKNGQIVTDGPMTKALQEAFCKIWGDGEGNGTPRVENLMVETLPDSADGNRRTQLYVRTKHAGPELVTGTVEFDGHSVKVSAPEATYISDRTNNEFIAFVDSKPIVTRQLEDLIRKNYLAIHGGIDSAKTIDLGDHQGIELAKLPEWPIWTGWGYSDITAKPVV